LTCFKCGIKIFEIDSLFCQSCEPSNIDAKVEDAMDDDAKDGNAKDDNAENDGEQRVLDVSKNQ
jgi:hypothetical protein